MLLDADDVEAAVRARCGPRAPAVPTGQVGIETEALAVVVDAAGRPRRRAGAAEVAQMLTASARVVRAEGLASRWRALDGGSLTLEPGGQLEHSTVPHPTAAAALDAAERQALVLEALLGQADVVLARTGLDVWHDVAAVPQQLGHPRYTAMAAYFAAGGGPSGPGAVMMRNTAALQVNLDAGSGTLGQARWNVANLVAPLVTATFATSPARAVVSGRAQAWQALDRTRTGFPAGFVDGLGDPADQVVRAAMDADVLLFRRDGTMVPGQRGFTFRRWVDAGHPRHGRPTLDDLDYHLTTLWHEVRLRGFLEIRGVDALPRRWAAVPVVLLTGLLYDDRARDEALAVLERHRAGLPLLAARAAARGLHEPDLCALAVETWTCALAGARRLPSGSMRGADLALTARFLDHFTLRGRCPSDELREQLDISDAAALAWATEPLETPTAA